MGKELKNKIYVGISLTAMICIIVSVGISFALLYRNIESDIVENNKVDARYLIYFLNEYGDESIEGIEIPKDRRLTLISKNGDVLYDSAANSDEMKNHKDRPEIISALEKGEGEDIRLSDTVSEISYYYAKKLENGNVLRLATTSDTVYETFKSAVPIVFIFAGCILVAALVVAKWQTKKIVRPINNINISEPETADIYDELAPFVARIRAQNKIIEEQVKDIRKKQIEFEAITRNMSEGLIVLGKEKKILSYNKSALILLGIDKPEDNDISIFEFNRSIAFEKAVEEAINGKSAGCVLQIGDRICQVLANGIKDGDKNKGAVIIIIDVTEKEKRETLRREFSANVSHELKTPLTSILGYAEIMKEGIALEKDTVKFSQIIYSEAQRLLGLVADIIKVSKLDEGKMEKEFKKTDLQSVVEEICDRLKPAMQKKEILLEIKTKGKNFEAETVPDIAEEMIYNVIDNAIKYGKNKGFVHVLTEEDDEFISITIEDNGIGIPKEDTERVFERFYRVDKSRSKAENGTGLGLSIVKHAAAYLNTKVKLESTLDKGTKIQFVFKKEQK